MTANRHHSPQLSQDEGIAIVGMSARFPGCRSVADYWAKISAGQSLLSVPSNQDLLSAGIDPMAADAMHMVRSGTVLEDAEWFDAKLFGITRREAETMDPQQRVFLECAYEALEDAGIATDGAGDGSRVGVFAGIGMNTYMMQLLGNEEMLAAAGGYQLMLGNDKDFLSTRVSFKLNLTGPAVAVQTACSTSLAAVHLACQSLYAGECDAAMAGGVSISFPQVAAYPYIPGMILSPDGVCRPFDAKAMGTVPGRGAGLVVLKRLSDAEAAGDTIYAVIAGSAWNNDGSGKVGYTAPSVAGQVEVIRAAQAAAGVSPARIGYVEAHGTGTELGDPIEVAALAEVFGRREPGVRPCVLGSVKANMGHADVAAGVAGLIKAALAIHHGSIPGTPHFERPNPALGLERTPFQVSSETSHWPEGEREHWAGVSSFGIGGTNVHLCLRGVTAAQTDPGVQDAENHETGLGPWIFPLSAPTPGALEAMQLRLGQFLANRSRPTLAPIASTLQHGRRVYNHRRAVVANSIEELERKLAGLNKSREMEERGPSNGGASRVVFLFPGQGIQAGSMASEFYERDEAFRAVVDRGLACLAKELASEIRACIREEVAPGNRVVETRVGQPLLFLVEYALAMRWMAVGVRPDALLGHSLGELTAAAVAGVFSFEDAMRLAAERGRCMQQMPEGAMVAVSLPVEEASRYLTQDLWIAAENASRLTVVSGSADAIAEAEQRWKKARVATVRLPIDRAFHTPIMADAASRFSHAVSQVERHAPAIPWLSNVTGTWITPEEAMSEQYWADQMTSRVRFAENAAALTGFQSRSRSILLEVGPGDALGMLIRQQDKSQVALSSLTTVRNRPEMPDAGGRSQDIFAFLEAAARIWEAGVDIAWEQLPANPQGKRRRVSLPTYPFERERFWVEKTQALRRVANGSAADTLSGVQETRFGKRQEVASWFYAPTWQRTPAATLVNERPKKRIQTWILLGDDSGKEEGSFALQLAAGLRSSGATVLVITPVSRVELAAFWKAHSKSVLGAPVGLIYCLPSRAVKPASLAGAGSAMEEYTALLQLVQTAVKARVHFAQLELVIENLVDVHGDRVEQPEHAVLEGVARTLPVEFSGMATRTIDPGPFLHDSQRAVASIIAEIETMDPFGATVAYRRGVRWQQVLLPVHVESPQSSRFRTGGTYVVTGGLGGVGYVLARYLMETYGAKLALIGRTELPLRGSWEEWITEHGPQHPVSRRIERVKVLESLRGGLLLLTADVADEAEMEAAWAEIEKRFGTVHGVIHAAGLSGSERWIAQTPESAAAVLRPKVEGSQVLAHLLARRHSSAGDFPSVSRGKSARPLDFLLFCSSVSSFSPLVGATAYAAANAFQDRYATWCRQHLGLPAMTVNLDAWREVGMIAEAPMPLEFEPERQVRLSLAMTVEEGLQVFERVLALGEEQLLVSTIDLAEVLTQVARKANRSVDVLNPYAPDGEKGGGSAPAIDTQTIAGQTPMMPETEAVIAIWRELLGAEQIDPQDNFFELGGHSLVGTMVLARVRKQFDVDLSIRAVFEAPTPESLGARIRQAEPARLVTPVTLQPAGEKVAAGDDREDFEF